jgi:hypothetical protein
MGKALTMVATTPACRSARLVAWAIVLSSGLGVTAARAQTGPQACGNPFQNHHGPFDYRTASVAARKLVEDFHFTVGIESMTRPKNTTFRNMAQDVQYTLNVFPNHHRALITMERLADRWKVDPAPGAPFPVECYFDRAIRFRPDDTVARALYAQFLARRGRIDQAALQLEQAVEHAQENPLSHYNIGLVFLEIGRHEQALIQAHRAMAMGYPRTELADKLKSAGRWREPE